MFYQWNKLSRVEHPTYHELNFLSWARLMSNLTWANLSASLNFFERASLGTDNVRAQINYILAYFHAKWRLLPFTEVEVASGGYLTSREAATG